MILILPIKEKKSIKKNVANLMNQKGKFYFLYFGILIIIKKLYNFNALLKII